jgi:hypothetical protein
MRARGAAPKGGVALAREAEPVAPGQLDLYEGRVVLACRDGKAGVGRLWLRRDAAGVVSAGLQPTSGAPLADGAEDLILVGVAVL